MNRLFNQREISRILSVPEREIKNWHRLGLISHIKKDTEDIYFDFKGLAAFRTLKELVKEGISLRRIKRCLEKLRKIMPDVNQPLSEIKIFIHKDKLILCKDNLRFTPDGQLLINFLPKQQNLIPLPVDKMEELFFQALELEEKGKPGEAQKKYETLLKLKPDHIDAIVNMGNIMYNSGLRKDAELCYRKALRLNPDHIEANYNLANLLEEKGDLDNAVLFYFKAIHENPHFADAFFNLARALERLGEFYEAKKYWLRYLELDPSSAWSEYVKKHLNNNKNKPDL